MTASRKACSVVQLTPAGRGAIASVLVAGTGATQHAARWFRPFGSRPLAECEVDRIVVGRWLVEEPGPDGESGDSVGEEVVVCRRADDRVEIHCHGGTAAIKRVIGSLEGAGCQRLDWQQWASCSGTCPLVSAAQLALARAPTQRTAAVLLDQISGALSRALGEVVELLEAGSTAEAAARLDRLKAHAAMGRHLVEPFRVVVVGRPNVGKSSLINAMVGYQRALVYPAPGTTRDVLTAATAVDGWPIELTDTAGIVESDDPIEREGVRRATRLLADADLVLLVSDVSTPWCEADAALASRRPDALLVHNKCDLLDEGRVDIERGTSGSEYGEQVESRPTGLFTSAVAGEGIDRLLAQIAQRLVPDPPKPGDPVPFTCEQQSALAAAEGLLSGGQVVEAAARLRCLLTGESGES